MSLEERKDFSVNTVFYKRRKKRAGFVMCRWMRHCILPLTVEGLVRVEKGERRCTGEETDVREALLYRRVEGELNQGCATCGGLRML